jgi:acetyl-CoA synthetase
MVYASMTHEYVFDYRDGDIYWCTADVGWVTGHSYIVYGPLANGATTLMFEGVPNYPDASRCWQVIDKHDVNIFYTAPTALRALMREGDAPVKKTSRKSLRLLGSVGEPINPEAWLWYHRVVADGDGRHFDFAAAGRDGAQTRLGDAALLRREARGGRYGRQGS